MKDGVLAVITAHNEMQYVKLNVQILRGELQGADSEIVVVDNCSDDGLQQWLMTQKNISYIVCDDKLEGYGEILKVWQWERSFAAACQLFSHTGKHCLYEGSLARRRGYCGSRASWEQPVRGAEMFSGKQL